MTLDALERGVIGQNDQPTHNLVATSPEPTPETTTEKSAPARPTNKSKSTNTQSIASWQAAYATELATCFFYSCQWFVNGATTIFSVAPAVIFLVAAGAPLLGIEDVPLVPLRIGAGVVGLLLHIFLSLQERVLWNYPTYGRWYQRLWQHTVHLWYLPRKQLIATLFMFGVDIGTCFYGLHTLLAGATLAIWTGITIPKDAGWLTIVITIAAIWIALTSEPGIRSSWLRAKQIKRYKDRFWEFERAQRTQSTAIASA